MSHQTQEKIVDVHSLPTADLTHAMFSGYHTLDGPFDFSSEAEYHSRRSFVNYYGQFSVFFLGTNSCTLTSGKVAIGL